MDSFERIDNISLGVLVEGTYTVILIGQNFAYYDTLSVPTATPDTNFNFYITAIDLSTHQPVANLPIELWIHSTAFTKIYDTTDISGTVTIMYENNAFDTLIYNIFTVSSRWPGYYGTTQVLKGIPEVITLGVGE